MLEQIGLPYDKIEKAGILIPVLGASCEYRISFRYAENFRIKVIPNGFNGIKMGLKYEIYGQEDGKLHAAGETSHCFLDRKMMPVHLKRDYPEIYNRLVAYMGDYIGVIIGRSQVQAPLSVCRKGRIPWGNSRSISGNTW